MGALFGGLGSSVRGAVLGAATVLAMAGAPAMAADAPVADDLSAAAYTQTIHQEQVPADYTVKPGDTLFEIAQGQGMSLKALLAANPQIKNPDRIHVGDTISWPKAAEYTVKAGDTLSEIAQASNHRLSDLLRANPEITKPNQISTGQTIDLPFGLGELSSRGLSQSSSQPQNIATHILQGTTQLQGSQGTDTLQNSSSSVADRVNTLLGRTPPAESNNNSSGPAQKPEAKPEPEEAKPAESKRKRSFLEKLNGELWKLIEGRDVEKSRDFGLGFAEAEVSYELAALETQGHTKGQKDFAAELSKNKREVTWINTGGALKSEAGDGSPWSTEGEMRFAWNRPYSYEKGRPNLAQAMSQAIPPLDRMPFSWEDALKMNRGSTFALSGTAELEGEWAQTLSADADADVAWHVERLEGQKVLLTGRGEFGFDAQLEGGNASGFRWSAAGEYGRELNYSYTIDLSSDAGRKAYDSLWSLSYSAAQKIIEGAQGAVVSQKDPRSAQSHGFGFGLGKDDSEGSFNYRRQTTSGETTTEWGVNAETEIDGHELGFEFDREIDSEGQITTRHRAETNYSGEDGYSHKIVARREEDPHGDARGFDASWRNRIDIGTGAVTSMELDTDFERVSKGELVTREGRLTGGLKHSFSSGNGLGFDTQGHVNYKLSRPKDARDFHLPTTARSAQLMPKGAVFEVEGGLKVGGKFSAAPDSIKVSARRGWQGTGSLKVERLSQNGVMARLEVSKTVDQNYSLGLDEIVSYSSDKERKVSRVVKYNFDLSKPSHRKAYDAFVRGDIAPAAKLFGSKVPGWQTFRDADQRLQLRMPSDLSDWLSGSIELNRALFDTDHNRVSGNALRKVSKDAWVEHSGAIAPKLGHNQTIPLGQGINAKVGFSSKGLLAYKVLLPEGQQVSAPPLTAERALALPAGAEAELQGSGELNGLTGVSLGAEFTSQGLEVGLSGGADYRKGQSRSWKLQVSRGAEELVKVRLVGSRASSDSLRLFTRLGAQVESAEWFEDANALQQISALEKATKKLDTKLEKLLSASLEYDRGVKRDSSVDLEFSFDLSDPVARKAYEGLMALDVSQALYGLRQSGLGYNSGVTVDSSHRGQAIEKKSRFEFNLAGESIYLREALRQESSKQGYQGDHFVQQHRVNYREQRGIFGYDKVLHWQAMNLRVDGDPVGRSFYRFDWSKEDLFTGESDVKDVQRLARGLGAQQKGKAKIESGAKGLAKLFGRHAKHGETKAELELYFTEQAIEWLRGSTTESAFVAYGLEVAERRGGGVPAWAHPTSSDKAQSLLKEYAAFGDHPDAEERNERDRVASEYHRNFNVRLSKDLDDFQGAQAFAKMIGQMAASPNPEDWNRALIDLGQEISFDFHDTLAAMGRMVGKDQLVVHKLSIQGDAVKLTMQDEGVLKEPQLP